MLLAALAVACAKRDSSFDKPPTRTVFTKAAPTVGAKRQESSELSMKVAMNVDGGRSEVAISESVKRTEEIIDVAGDAITKTKVTFDDVKSTQPSALPGKTFVVEARDGGLEIVRIALRDAKANADTDAKTDAREVEKYLRNLGKPDPMLAALPSGGVSPGERVDGVAKVIGDQLRESGDGMTASDVVVTFKETRGEDGVFDVSLKLTKDEGSTKMTITVKGDVWVSTKTSSTTRMDLAGPVTISGATTGSGTMSMKLDAKGL